MQINSRVRKSIRIIVLIVVSLIILVFAAYLAIRSILTPARMRAMAENAAREMLQRPVVIGSVGIHFGLNIGITIEDIEVDNTEGFRPGSMIQIDRTVMNLRLMPLLSRKISISSIELKEALVNLERNKNNELNLAIPMPEQKGGKGWEVALNEIKLSNGTLHYWDAITGRQYTIQDMDQAVRFQHNRITTIGKLTVHIPKYKDVPELDIRVTDAFDYDTVIKTAAIRNITIAAKAIQLKVSGIVEKSRALNLQGNLKIDDMSKLVSLIPGSARPSELGGAIKTDFTVKGSMDKPAISGRCEISNVKVMAKGMERAIEKINGALTFNRSAIEDIMIQGNIGNAKFNIKGGISDLTTKNPLLNILATLDGDLKDFQALTRDLKDIQMNGPLAIKATFKGSINKPQYTGDVKINGANISGIGLAKPISNMYFGGRLQDDKLKIDNWKFSMGRSDFNLKGQISSFKKPVIQIDNRSNYIDLDELLPAKKGAGSEPQEMQPLPVTLTGSFNVTRLTGMNMEFRNIRTNIEYEAGVIDLRDCQAETFDGQVYFSFYYDANRPEPYRISTRMQSIAAEKILQRFLNFSRLKGEMSGTADFQGKGLDQESVKSNLNATGNLKLNQGEFNNFPLLTNLLDWLGLKNYNNVEFNNLQCSFQIANGNVMVKDWTLSSRIGNFLTNGTIGLNGSTDLHIAVTLSKQHSDIVKKYHGDWLFYVDKQGSAVIDMIVSGKLNAASFKLDASKMRERLTGKLKDEFEKKKEDFEQQLKNLFKGKW